MNNRRKLFLAYLIVLLLVAGCVKNATVTVDVTPKNSGKIIGEGEYEVGSTVNLRAQPNKSYVFSGWEKNNKIIEDQNKYKFTIESDEVLTAKFKPKKYVVTLKSNIVSAKLDGAGEFDYKSMHTINAEDTENFKFIYWEDENGDVFTKKRSEIITVDKNIDLKAIYEKNDQNLYLGLFRLSDSEEEILKLKLRSNQNKLAKIKKDGRYVFVNILGETVIERKYDKVSKFSEGYVAVKKDSQWAYIDYQGNQITDFIFDNVEDNYYGIHHFKNGHVIVVRDGKYGLINAKGEFVIKPRFDLIKNHYIYDDLIKVKKDEKFGYINFKDEVVIDSEYDELEIFSEGLAAIKLDEQWGFINKDNEIIIKPKYEEVGIFSEGLAAVKINGQWGFINKENEFIIKPKYERVEKFSEGLAPVKRGDYWKYIDRSDNIVISNNFIQALPFRDHRAGVIIGNIGDEIAGKSHLWMDRKGNIIKNTEYLLDGGCGFKDMGLYLIRKDGKSGFIDRNGNIVIKPSFDKISPFENGFARFEENDKWGHINLKGEIAIEAKYDMVFHFYNGIAKVRYQNEEFYINKEDKRISGDELLEYDINKWLESKVKKGETPKFRDVLKTY